MAELSTQIDFTREEFSASLRVLLVGLSEWVEQILGGGAISRSVQSVTGNPCPDLSRHYSAGALIEQSPFLDRMLQVYDFVVTGSWDRESLFEFGHELECFSTLCRLTLESHVGMSLAPSIDPARLPSPQAMCGLVIDHAEARWALLRGQDLRLSQVAMLAGLAEKTVRMAANPKNSDRLTTHKDGHNTFVSASEAVRWLSTKPGYRPTVMTDDPGAPRVYSSVSALAAHCRALRAQAGLELPELFNRLAWPRSLQKTYRQLEVASIDLDPRPLTIQRLIGMGRALGVEDATAFAKNAALVLAPMAIELECAAALADA
jgi:hypothetical protein